MKIKYTNLNGERVTVQRDCNHNEAFWLMRDMETKHPAHVFNWAFWSDSGTPISVAHIERIGAAKAGKAARLVDREERNRTTKSIPRGRNSPLRALGASGCMTVYLVQYLCPQRHCIIAAAYEDNMTTFATVVEMMKARLAELKVDPWCALCGSRSLHFEQAATKFLSVDQAMPVLKLAEASNLETRDRILRGN